MGVSLRSENVLRAVRLAEQAYLESQKSIAASDKILAAIKIALCQPVPAEVDLSQLANIIAEKTRRVVILRPAHDKTPRFFVPGSNKIQ